MVLLCSDTVLEMVLLCSDTVLEMVLLCSGNVLEMFWKCSGNVLEMDVRISLRMRLNAPRLHSLRICSEWYREWMFVLW